MHEGSGGSWAFIFDLMGPERPATDRKVLEFIKGHVSTRPILLFDRMVCAG
jgi:hypothetical protein